MVFVNKGFDKARYHDTGLVAAESACDHRSELSESFAGEDAYYEALEDPKVDTSLQVSPMSKTAAAYLDLQDGDGVSLAVIKAFLIPSWGKLLWWGCTTDLLGSCVRCRALASPLL